MPSDLELDLRAALLGVLDMGVPPNADLSDRRRARIISAATLGIVILGWPTFFFYQELKVPALAWFLFGMASLGVANLVWMRRSGDVDRAGHGAIGILFAWLITENCVVGGIHDPNFAWLNVIPVAAFQLLSTRGAVAWVGATLFVTLGFWLAAEVGWSALHAVPLDQRGIQAFLNRATAVAAFGLLAWGFVVAQRRAERDLVREAGYVNLLRHAASSVADTDSVASALKQAASRLAQELGWLSALIYRVDADGQASLVDVAYLDADATEGLDSLAQLSGERSRALPAHAVKTGRVATLNVRDHGRGPRGERARQLGIGTAWAVPIYSPSRRTVVAVLEFWSRDAARMDPRLEGVLGLFGETLGRVADRAAAKEEEQVSRRITAVGTLAAGLAHELNNPLAYARANLAQLEDTIEGAGEATEKGEAPSLDECLQLVRETHDGVERAISLVRDMRKLSQLADTDFERVDVGEWVQRAIRFSAPSRPQGVELHVDVPPQLATRGAPNLLHQVLVNLIENAIQSVGDRGHVSVSARAVPGGLSLRVDDDGAGIPEELQGRLFEPFLTTRAEGTGLGLYVVFEVIRRHGGRIQVESSVGSGARFEVWLPANPTAGESDPAQA